MLTRSDISVSVYSGSAVGVARVVQRAGQAAAAVSGALSQLTHQVQKLAYLQMQDR